MEADTHREATTAAAGTAHPAPLAGPEPEARPVQLLHFEANPEDTRLLQRVLAADKLAAEVLRVDTTTDLLTTLKECRFDVIVANPEGSSLGCAELLARMAEIHPELPVILFVSDLAPDQKRRAIQSGASEVVHKSSPAKLATAVREAISFAQFRFEGPFQPLELLPDEAALRDTAEAAGQAFWLMAVDSAEVIHSTPAFAEQFPAAATQGRAAHSWLNLLAQEDREPIAQLLDLHLREGEVAVELHPVGRDPEAEPVVARLTPIRNAEGRTIHIAGTAAPRSVMYPPQAPPTPVNDRAGLGEATLALPDLVFLLNADGTIAGLHAGDREDLVLTEEQVLGRPIMDLGRRGVADQFAQALDRIRQTNAPETFDYSIARPSGVRHYEARLVALPAGRFTAVIRNITEQVQREQALRESHRRLELEKLSLAAADSRNSDLVENAADGIYRCASDGRFLSANPAAARMFGSPSTVHLLSNRTKFDSGLYLDTGCVAEFQRQLQQHGRVERFEYQLRRPDGSILWLLENARAIRDAAGRVTHFDGTMTDVTTRRQMEQALRDSEMLYHSLIENVPVCLFRKDLTGRITYVNKRMADLIQCPVEAILGKTDHELFPAEIADQYVSADRAVMQTGDTVKAEEDHVTATGRRLNLHTIKTPLRDAAGNIVGVQGVLWDVTERWEAESAMRENKRRLELTLDQLRSTQQQIVQQERLSALGQMASGIAHDFNNTLMAILGFTELLLTHPDTLDQRDKVVTYLKTMSRAAKDAAGVVKRLNDFYRHRDESEILPPVDVRQLVQQIIPLTQPKWKDQALANGAQINVVTQLNDVLPVPGNEVELRECLMNLIFNAVDAMPQGGTLSLATRLEGDAVIIEVADTGGGMSDEVRKRCFEPFFSTKGQRGTGLGLAMVFGTIQRHQGTIDLKSEIGKGTRLLIRLPALKEAGPRGGDTEILGAPTRPLSVLVVDDEPLIREILTEYLLTDGHTVQTAVDGREALQMFGESQFDLVMTDRSMPQMNGDQLAGAIKKVDPTRPVVLLTGFGDMMKATGQKPAGIDVIMSKPITLNGLRLSLAEAVRAN